MELAIVLILLVMFFTWFIHGLMNSNNERLEKALDEYYEAIEENRKADDMLSDYERIKRVQEHFND